MTGQPTKLTSGMLTASFAAKGAPPESRNRKGGKPTGTISLRVTPNERHELETAASGMSLSAYVRERLFGDAVAPRRTRGKFPVKDHRALAEVLRALGATSLARDFEALNWAVRDGTVYLDEDSATAFQKACADVSAMHDRLLAALGSVGSRR